MERTARIDHIPQVLYHWRKLPESTASAGTGQAVGARRRPAGARGLRPPQRHRRRGAAGRRPGPLPRPAPDSGSTARVDRHPDRRPVARRQRHACRPPGQRDPERRPEDAYDAYEIIVVADEGGVPATTTRALAGTRHTVLAFARLGLFNFSAKINAGVSASSGEHVLLFNDDLEAISPEWLSAMLEYSQEQAIGAVGAKLLYPDGRLQHIGMVLGVAGLAAHAFHQHSGCFAGLRRQRHHDAQLLGRHRRVPDDTARVFDEVGGFDERFPIDFNDVDYCLRLRQAGYRVVFTPWAQLYHHESASFGVRRQDLAELAEMRRRWADVIDRDPYLQSQPDSGLPGLSTRCVISTPLPLSRRGARRRISASCCSSAWSSCRS